MGATFAGIGVGVRRIIVDGERSPNAVSSLINREAERRRHDADHGVEISTEANATTNNRRIGTELRHPERVADQNYTRANLFLVCGEASPEFRTNAQRR